MVEQEGACWGRRRQVAQDFLLMHVRQLIELAAHLSAQARTLIRCCRRLSLTCVQQYAQACDQRQDGWERVLARYRELAAEADGGGREELWLQVRSTTEEIFLADVLARVWGAVLAAHDQAHHQRQLGPLAEATLLIQSEIVKDAHALLVRAPYIPLAEAARLIRLRGRAERWTDLLLAHLVSDFDIRDFTVNPERARDFASEYRGPQATQHFHRSWPLVLTALKSSFAQDLHERSPSAQLNRRIAQMAVACLGPEMFDSTGRFPSLWMTRLMATMDDVEVMIRDVLGSPAHSGSPDLKRFHGEVLPPRPHD